MSEAQPWDAFLLAHNARREGFELLPERLQRAVTELVDALVDMARETYSATLPGDAKAELGVRVDSSSTGTSGRAIRNADFHEHLSKRIPRRLEGMRTEARRMYCVTDPPRGPYQRRSP